MSGEVPDLSRLSEQSRRSVEELLRSGHKIAAIKQVRQELQIGLAEAKQAVEAHMTALGISQRSSGCLVLAALLGGSVLLALSAL